MEEFDLFKVEDLEEDIIEPVIRIRKRYIRDAQNPLEYFEEREFQRRYRFSKNCVVHTLVPLLIMDLHKENNRGLPISPLLQVLLALRFYGSNSFQVIHGDVAGLSQSTVCRIIERVSVALAEKMPQFIKFPNNVVGFAQNTTAFYNMWQFPAVSGCIDCTHISISNPGGNNSEVFRNRKGWFSLNVQVVCGPALEMLDIVVRHPGSSHDSVIFNRSAARARFYNGQIPGHLLGDNGYACQNYLLTPVINPDTPNEERYNFSHIRTRNCIERLFGIWKRRFFCLQGGLRTKLDTTIAIICATAVLYNIGRQQNQNHILEEDYEENEPVDRHPVNDGLNNVGLAFRRAFIYQHF